MSDSLHEPSMTGQSSSFRQKGTKVTICSDAEGTHPRYTGVVKRIGNGAWRLAGCSEWYDFDGKRAAADESGEFGRYDRTTHFARLYREGDEAAIAVEDERVKKYQRLQSTKSTLEWNIRQDRNNVQGNLHFADRSISNAKEQVAAAERKLDYAKRELEMASTARAKAVERNTEHTKTITENEAKLALLEAELARFGTEW